MAADKPKRPLASCFHYILLVCVLIRTHLVIAVLFSLRSEVKDPGLLDLISRLTSLLLQIEVSGSRDVTLCSLCSCASSPESCRTVLLGCV